MPLTMVYAADEQETAETGDVVILLNINVYKAVKAQLQAQGITAEFKDSNDMIIISQEELAKVTKLDLSNSEISDLSSGYDAYKGLDAFKNLTEINLHANYLTVNSNLHILDSLTNLTKVDLSSNQLTSVKSITNFHNGKTEYDITDQRIVSRNIIVVDDSSESESRQLKAITNLPDILLEDDNGFDPAWLLDRNGFLTRTHVEYTDPETGRTTAPEIDYERSFWTVTASAEDEEETESNDQLAGYLNYVDEDATAPYPALVIDVATGSGSSYYARKGLVKFQILVNDSTSKLADTQMTFYYAVVNQDETGIAFDDGNLYRAIKEQLTEGQTINDDTALTKITDDENVYSRAYDEALIMVIDTDKVINNIKTLILHDKRIKNLKGIEEFIGLETELNVAYNYISTLQRILELEENKTAAEAKIQAKYAEVLEKLSTIRGHITSLREQKEKKEKEISDKQRQYSEETDTTKQANLLEDLGKLEDELAKIESELVRYYGLQKTALDKLYMTFAREYLLTGLIPYEIDKLSFEELGNTTLAMMKTYANTIVTKVSNLEKAKALSSEDTVNIMNYFGISATEEEPISKFFETRMQEIDLGVSDQYAAYYDIVNAFKYLDLISKATNYCLLERMSDSGITDCLFEEGLENLKDWYETNDLDTTYVQNLLTSGNAWERLFPSCDGAYTQDTEIEYRLAGKLVNASADIPNYITLPALQKLNMEDNRLRNLAGIDVLIELKELNAWKNLVNDISNVDWTQFKKLKVLNLGFNQISNIKPLEVLHNLEQLVLSYNLLSGRFDFNLINMRNLVWADFSHNQYYDIGYVNDQYILKALGYDGSRPQDGYADGYIVSDYLRAAGITLLFQYQTLEMSTTISKTSEFVEFELPLIFRQLETLDHSRTSYSVDSIGGIVEPEGKTVKLRVPGLGEYTATVGVTGRSGYGYTEEGVGFGTTCVIKYTVVEANIPEPTEPTDPSDPEDPTDPTDPEDPTDPTDPTDPGEENGDLNDLVLGYSIANGYVFVYTPETTLDNFKTQLVDNNNYNVAVTDNKSSSNIGTGSVVTISSKTSDYVYGMLEVVVKGDINGDGDVDALDSGLVRGVVNDTSVLTGAYGAAADVNSDTDTDSLDSLLILQYRADRISDFVK